MTPRATARSSPQGVVILGTDTGAGKTTFTAALLRLARRSGLEPVPHKPVETGWADDLSDSARLLAASQRTDLQITDVCPVRLSLPTAPSVAAAASGVTLDGMTLTATARLIAMRGNLLVVETAGGLLCPYAPRLTSADLAASLALPTILVARNGLGTVNHTCLTILEMRRRQLPLAALVLVDTTADRTPDRPHNGRLIAEQTNVTPLVTLPFVRDTDPDQLADALAAQISAADLFARIGVRLPRQFTL